MKLNDFIQDMNNHGNPVILLEGTRAIPEEHHQRLTDLSALLARELPNAVFRSGNADGSDTLFARGVESVEPARMQLVTPTAGHRKKNRHPDNHVISLDCISESHEALLAQRTNEATPKNRQLIDKRNAIPRLKAKARYLLRDTLKVTGDPDNNLAPATGAIFYTKPDPMEGGTGHTIRVCQQAGIPVLLQKDWWRWID